MKIEIASLLMISVGVLAVTKCMRTKGRLMCQTNSSLAANVDVWLYDYDGLPGESDDTMGHTRSDDNGYFSVGGCAADFGPWNKPDPYLYIEHFCRRVNGDKISIGLWPTFLPDESNAGTIRLDDKYD